MARIKLEMPTSFSFITTIPVRITDVNYGGHVGNDAILSIAHEARMQFLAHHGYSEMNVDAVSLIMNDAGIEFKGEAFYGDKIIVAIAVANFSKISFDLFYKMEKESDSSLIALVKTGMLGFNYEKKKIASFSDTAKKKLSGIQ